jgi:hypothetical protein
LSHSCPPLTLLAVMMAITPVKRARADCAISRARCMWQTQTQFVVFTFFGATKTMHIGACPVMKTGIKLLWLIMMRLLYMLISLKISVGWLFNRAMVMLRMK